MKITQLFKIYWPDNGGGIAKVMESIADGMPDCSHEIIVCQDSRHKKSEDDEYKGVPVRRCRQLFDFASTPFSLRFLYDVKKRTRDCDIVICHFPYPMADLAVLFGMYSGSLVVWWHCGFEKYKKLAPVYGLLARHTLQKADQILVSSKENVVNSRLLWTYRKKCRAVPFCVSDECLKRGREHTTAAARAREHAQMQENARFKESAEKQESALLQEGIQACILFIGRLVWYKGCDILLKAFAGMKHKGCRLVLAGSGPLEQELKSLAASLGLKNVEFAGMVSEEEKIRRIEECDFLVLPSISEAEAFGVVQLEAMAFGKPVINTALRSGVPHVSIDGVTGRTVKPGSVRGLAAAMDELAGDEGLRRKYGAAAFKMVQEKYTQEKMVRRYRRIFKKLLDDPA